ncbi:NUDIX domain-containing protein [Streptomyces iconiensis]|uniref:NUDIX domain-containing protein n=1 Tax=Streptomyces iconiensis TaxID=1384038 RepID=A0ABT7A309_9ACTN|nr:NUDIX domain-containing protein [Streptomyces iconiensis]MDJ1135459.1 NUDIX domain-containing protein [Streptomyces iconiensis]
MAISDAEISRTHLAYIERYPEEAVLLAEPVERLRQGSDFDSRRTFPVHVTAGALLVRDGVEILLSGHRAYGLTLQPGGHLEPVDTTLVDAAVRELAEETGTGAEAVRPVPQTPAYVEYGCAVTR